MTPELRAARKQVKELREYLAILVTNVEATLTLLDAEMAKPSDVERGRRIAKLINGLEMAKDRAKRFGLKIDFDGESIGKRKK